MPIGDGSEELYYFTYKWLEAAYSLELGENPTITVPYNETTDQTCNISEFTDSEGVTTITIKKISILGGAKKDWEFTVVPSHTFSDVPYLTEAFDNGDGTHSVDSGYICTCEHTEDEIRLFLLIEVKEEHTCVDGKCTVCDYESETV